MLGDPLLKMDGPAVFKLAVSVLDKVARSVLEKAGLTEADMRRIQREENERADKDRELAILKQQSTLPDWLD